jgi:hypothetical protein
MKGKRRKVPHRRGPGAPKRRDKNLQVAVKAELERQRITHAMIAERCGVTTSAVDSALNHKEGLTPYLSQIYWDVIAEIVQDRSMPPN